MQEFKITSYQFNGFIFYDSKVQKKFLFWHYWKRLNVLYGPFRKLKTAGQEVSKYMDKYHKGEGCVTTHEYK